jgi:hypothetical protein
MSVSIFEATFEKAFTRVSEPREKMFDEKETRGRKSRVRVFLRAGENLHKK